MEIFVYLTLGFIVWCIGVYWCLKEEMLDFRQVEDVAITGVFFVAVLAVWPLVFLMALVYLFCFYVMVTFSYFINKK